jgi:aryl-alcohol dehydrogenase-like predicted oxidoreductase
MLANFCCLNKPNKMVMELRQLGKNGPMVSSIGLGCMGMSDMYGSIETRNDAQSIETIKFALDSGMNFLDTGDYYGAGHNELLIREAISKRQEKPVTAVQVEYSLASRVIEKELLHVCRELGIGIVAYGVLSRGLLSGQLTG